MALETDEMTEVSSEIIQDGKIEVVGDFCGVGSGKTFTFTYNGRTSG